MRFLIALWFLISVFGLEPVKAADSCQAIFAKAAQTYEHDYSALTGQPLYERVLYLLNRPNEDPELFFEKAAIVDEKARNLNWLGLRRAAKRDSRKKRIVDAVLARLADARTRLSTSINGSQPNVPKDNTIVANANWVEAENMIWNWIERGEAMTPDHLRQLHLRLQFGQHNNGGAAGQFRHAGEDVGAGYDPTRAYVPGAQVATAMDDFFSWYNSSRDKIHPLALAGGAYQRLVSIHPFRDGNGRLSRLVMDWILQSYNYPPSALGANFVDNNMVAVFGRKSDAENVFPGKAELAPILGLNMTLRILESFGQVP